MQSDALSVLRALKARGFEPAVRNRLTLGGMRDQYRTLAEDKFVARLERGDQGLALRKYYDAVPIGGTEDLTALGVFHANLSAAALAHPALATTLLSLQQNDGYRFWVGGRPASPYQAYQNALHGEVWLGSRNGPLVQIPPQHIDDSQAMMASMNHALDEVQALTKQGVPVDAAVAFQHQRPDRHLAGDESPEFKEKAFVQLLAATGRIGSAQRMWQELGQLGNRAEALPPFSNEVKYQRGDVTRALRTLHLLNGMRWENETLAEVGRQLSDVRQNLGQNGQADATAIFQYIRGQAAEVVPPKLEPEWQYLHRSMLVATMARVLGTWSAMHYPPRRAPLSTEPISLDAETKARLEVFRRVFEMQTNANPNRACDDLTVVLRNRRNREPIDEALGDLAKAHEIAKGLDKGDGIKVFETIRHIEDNLKGPWSAQEKRDMFLQHLATFRSLEHAMEYWPRLVSPDKPDLPARLEAFRRTTKAETFHDYGLEAYQVLQSLKRPDESWEEIADSYAAIRSTFGSAGDGRRKGACEVFERMRQTDLTQYLPMVPDLKERESLFAQLFKATACTATSVEVCGKLQPLVAEGQTVPQLIRAFVELQQNQNESHVTLEALTAIQQQPGDWRERLDDYKAIRDHLYMNYRKDGPKLYEFVKSLPEEQRPLLLKIQGATLGLEDTRRAWQGLLEDPGTERFSLSERVDQLYALIDARRGTTGRGDAFQPSLWMRTIFKEARPTETLQQATAAFLGVRDAVMARVSINTNPGTPWALEDRARDLFVWVRAHLTEQQTADLLEKVRQLHEPLEITYACKLSEKLGNPARMELLPADTDKFKQFVQSLEWVDQNLPPEVDRDRGSLALLTAAAEKGPGAIAAIMDKLTRIKSPDRTAAVEWVADVMHTSDSVEEFERAWKDGLYVHLEGADEALGPALTIESAEHEVNIGGIRVPRARR